MEPTYEEKQKRIMKISRFSKRQKHILITKRFHNDFEGSQVITKLTSIIISLIELDEIYMECRINEQDSLIDSLRLQTPEFYNISQALYNINKKLEEEKTRSQKRRKYGIEDNNSSIVGRGIKLKRKLLLINQEALILKDDE